MDLFPLVQPDVTSNNIWSVSEGGIPGDNLNRTEII